MTDQPNARASWARWLGRVQLWLAAFAIVAIMLVTVADVLMRYLFNNPVRGTYDLTEVMLVVFVFHGMAACFLQRQNIVIDLIDSALVPRGRAALERLGDVVSLAVLLFLAYAAWTPASQAFGSGETKLQLALPVWVLWALALSGMAGTILCAIWVVLVPGHREPGGATE